MCCGEDKGQSSHQDLQGTEGGVLRFCCGLRQVLEHGEFSNDGCKYTELGLSSVMNLTSFSTDLTPFVFLFPQAMVDVDETYREPLLGEAFYHEKALTISRVGTAFSCISD